MSIEQHIRETEPKTRDAAHVGLEQLGEVWAYPPVDGNAHAAVYEALAAFVDAF